MNFTCPVSSVVPVCVARVLSFRTVTSVCATTAHDMSTTTRRDRRGEVIRLAVRRESQRRFQHFPQHLPRVRDRPAQQPTPIGYRLLHLGFDSRAIDVNLMQGLR